MARQEVEMAIQPGGAADSMRTSSRRLHPLALDLELQDREEKGPDWVVRAMPVQFSLHRKPKAETAQVQEL